MKISFSTKTTRLTLWTVVFLNAVLLSGIVYAKPDNNILNLSDKDHSMLLSLGEKVVGKALPANPIKSTAKLMPLHQGTWVYRITAGDRKGATQKVSIVKTHHRGDNILWSRSIHEESTEFFSVQADGTIQLVSEMDLKQNVITHYSPAIPFMFDGMKPGQAKEVETNVKVYDLHDPTFLKYHGKLKVTHTYLGRFRINVPAGNFDANLIRSAYAGKVGPAHVADVGYVFYARDVGVVASVKRMHVSAFLFYNKQKQTPKVLIENSEH